MSGAVHPAHEHREVISRAAVVGAKTGNVDHPDSHRAGGGSLVLAASAGLSWSVPAAAPRVVNQPALVIAVLLIVALASAFLPARAATRVDPIAALKSE